MKNWKTNSAGIVAIAGAIGSLLTAWSTGHLDATTIGTAITGIVSGIGLFFAKDHDVTGGTRPQ